MEKIIIALLFLYSVLFPLGQFARLPIQIPGFPEIRTYLTDIIIFLIFSAWGVWRFLFRKRKFSFPPLAKPIFLFSSIATLSLIVNSPFRVNLQGEPLLTSREVMVAALYLIRLLTYFGFYFAIHDLKTYFNLLKWQNLEKYLIFIGLAVAVFGLAQYLFLPDVSFLEDFGWDPHYYRLIGTFLDPGFTGIILALGLILSVVIYWKKLNKFNICCLLFIVYLALALTYSRASYLAFLTGMGVIAWIKKSPKFFLMAVLISVLTLVFLPRPGGVGVKLERETTAQARLGSWQQTLIIALDHPIFGVGFNAYRYAQRNYGFLAGDWLISHAGAGADSSFLFVLATTGIIGLVAYLWLWLAILKLSLKERNSPVGLVVLASVTALLTHSWFNNSLFYPWVMGWLGIILALL